MKRKERPSPVPRKRAEWKPALSDEEIEEAMEVVGAALNIFLKTHPHTPPDLRRIAEALFEVAEAYDERGAEWAMSVGADE